MLWGKCYAPFTCLFLQFNQLYGQAIDMAERAVVPTKRIDNIIERLTFDVFTYFQRGLFERHKITFSLMLAIAILISGGKVHLQLSHCCTRAQCATFHHNGHHTLEIGIHNHRRGEIHCKACLCWQRCP